MAWPDLRKRLFAYVLGRLQLFTNVGADKLEVGSSSLCLSDVEVDPSRLSVPGITVEQAVVGSLKVKLSASGVFLEASDVVAKAQVDQFEPELALSTILEQTRTDLATQVAEDGVGYGIGDVSGVMVKLADIALAQLSCNVNRILLRLAVGDTTFLVTIATANMSSQKTVTIEDVEIEFDSINPDSDTETATPSLHSESFDSGNNSDSDDESQSSISRSMMIGSRSVRFASDLTRSVYYDTYETSEPSLPPPPVFAGRIAGIDRLIFNYSFNPLTMSIAVENVEFELFTSLEALIVALNAVFDRITLPGEDVIPATSETRLDLTIKSVSLKDEDHIATIGNISARMPTISIEQLHIPGVVQVFGPLAIGSYGPDGFAAELPLPLLITLPESNLPYAAQLVQRAGSILARLQAPPNPRPTPVEIILPELKLVLGDVTLLVFPEAVSNSGIRLREVTIFAGDGQLLLHDIDIAEGASIVIRSLRLRQTENFYAAIRDAIGPFHNLQSTGESTSRPPQFPQLRIDDICVESEERPIASGSFALSKHGGTADISLKWGSNWATASATIEREGSAIRIIARNLAGKIWLDQLDQLGFSTAAMTSSQSGSYQGYHGLWDWTLQANIAGEIAIHHQQADFKLRSKEDIVAEYMGGNFNLSISSIDTLLIDTDDDDAEVEILRIRDASVDICRKPLDINIALGKLFWDCCADSYARSVAVISSLVPRSVLPKFEVEPNEPVDILEGLNPDYGTDPSLGLEYEVSGVNAIGVLDGEAEPRVEHSGELNIVDGYMAPSSRRDASEGSSRTDIESCSGWEDGITGIVRLSVSKVRWQAFDGFDLEATRKTVQEAISRVENATNKSKNAPETDPNEALASNFDSEDDNETIVGDVLYNSVFIGAAKGQSGLRRRIQETVGTSSLRRASRPKLRLGMVGIIIQSQQLASDHSGLCSRTDITIADVAIEDIVTTSKFERLLERQTNLQAGNSILVIHHEVVDQMAPEQRFVVRVEPLRVRLDQDTLEFITRFFEFRKDPDTAEPSFVETSQAYIQRAEIHDISLCVDYFPRKVDYAGLRSGYVAELVNVFALVEAKVVLRHAILHGMSGYDRLLSELGSLWGPEITAHQLGGIITSVAPVRQVLQFAAAASGEARDRPLVFLRKTANGIRRYWA